MELSIQQHHCNRLQIIHGGTIASLGSSTPFAAPPSNQLVANGRAVDLGGSLAVASRGLYATGVSTDLNVTYLNSGGKVGDTLKAIVTCDKCELSVSLPCSLIVLCVVTMCFALAHLPSHLPIPSPLPIPHPLSPCIPPIQPSIQPPNPIPSLSSPLPVLHPTNTPIVGKTLAYTSASFTTPSGELAARGSHTKYVAFAWKDERNKVEELSPKPEAKAGSSEHLNLRK